MSRRRWSPRATLLFVGLISAALWALIIALTAGAVRLSLGVA